VICDSFPPPFARIDLIKIQRGRIKRRSEKINIISIISPLYDKIYIRRGRSRSPRFRVRHLIDGQSRLNSTKTNSRLRKITAPVFFEPAPRERTLEESSQSTWRSNEIACPNSACSHFFQLLYRDDVYYCNTLPSFWLGTNGAITVGDLCYAIITYIETDCWIYNSVKNIIPDDCDTRRAEIISVKNDRVSNEFIADVIYNACFLSID
jgi:hypothetical protein